MIECPIPQDILKYKTKFIGNFSTRETIWLALGGITAVGSFFTFLSGVETDIRIMLAACLALPFFAIGFVKPLGQPFEKVILSIIFDNFICPPVRKKEIRHPEFEKFESTPKWMQSGTEDEKKKKKSSNSSKEKIKIKASKEYKAIK